MATERIINKTCRKLSTWESLPDTEVHDYFKNNFNNHLDQSLSPVELYDQLPKLKVFVVWTKGTAVNGCIQRSELCDDKENRSENVMDLVPMNNNNNTSNNNNYDFRTTSAELEIKKKEKKLQFQFIYNNCTRQQNEERTDYLCPWCGLNCMVLYSLLKHLKLCHSRLTFIYVPEAPVPRIDVAINELYDGSFGGSPHEQLQGPVRSGPFRRTSFTNCLVTKHKRSAPTLSEFLESDEAGESDSMRVQHVGHKRIYFHTETCLPVDPREIDIDSEGESDPQWLQRKTKQMIDEFSDVNEGEKELMKLWNLHIMKFG